MDSTVYKNWIANLALKNCAECKKRHGKIFLAEEPIDPEPPLHWSCRCVIRWVKALHAGTATSKGNDGADWWIKWTGSLPDYYITRSEAKANGYDPEAGNLATVLPGRMLNAGKYRNKNGHLPQESERVWYEADINYESGYRGSDRIVWSNDGLVFVTYDHYETFQEII